MVLPKWKKAKTKRDMHYNMCIKHITVARYERWPCVMETDGFPSQRASIAESISILSHPHVFLPQVYDWVEGVTLSIVPITIVVVAALAVIIRIVGLMIGHCHHQRQPGARPSLPHIPRVLNPTSLTLQQSSLPPTTPSPDYTDSPFPSEIGKSASTLPPTSRLPVITLNPWSKANTRSDPMEPVYAQINKSTSSRDSTLLSTDGNRGSHGQVLRASTIHGTRATPGEGLGQLPRNVALFRGHQRW